MEERDLVVIGSSAGGVTALRDIVATFPADLKAAVFIVQHLSPDSESRLNVILSGAGKLPASYPKDGEEIKRGHIYIAPPDHHMIVKGQSILVRRSPKENRFRPSIDAAMRSVAYQFGPRAIGVVITGRLNDGTSGLWSIKEMGGTTIVQSPEDALFADMPNSVLANVEVDYVTPLAEIGPLIVQLVGQQVTEEVKVQPDVKERLKAEVDIAAEQSAFEEGITKMGEKTNLTCPECGGALVSVQEGKLLRYRCHTGHGYSADSLWLSINESIETKLWQALRSIEEGIIFLEQSATHCHSNGDEEKSEEYHTKADELKARSKELLSFIYE